MSIFIESPSLPDWISAWAQGGRRFHTDIVQTEGGNEYRNSPWTFGLGRWTFRDAMVSTNTLNAHAYTNLLNFLMSCKGEFGGFRFYAPMDHDDAGNGVLGTTGLAVAATLAYQMYKNYPIGSVTGQGIVLKPWATGITVYNNGVLQSTPGQYSYSSTTGIVTFVSQPTVGHTLTWKGSFDIPVRIDGDDPQFGLTNEGAYFEWSNFAVVELRNP